MEVVEALLIGCRDNLFSLSFIRFHNIHFAGRHQERHMDRRLAVHRDVCGHRGRSHPGEFIQAKISHTFPF